MMINIPFDENFNIREYRKLIGFISSAITGYEIRDGELIIRYDTELEDAEILREKIIHSIRKFVNSEDAGNLERFADNKKERKFFSHEEVLNGKDIVSYKDGTIVLRNSAILLYQYFDSVFRSFAMELGASEEQYPVLLPLRTYSDTGYLRNSPQYSIFCSEAIEDMEILKQLRSVTETADKAFINPAGYALSPSACFHVYEAYRGQTLPDNCTITLRQSVFRNEGRFNWEEFGRLRDYHVREIVFIGSPDYVEDSRRKTMEMTGQYMKRIGLSGTLISSADCFIIPQMQRFKRIQIQEKLKYEWRLLVGEQEDMAVASFNLHGTNFSRPFRIKVEGTDTVTGCVGFGLERMVLAFLSQFGTETAKWPEEIMDFCLKG